MENDLRNIKTQVVRLIKKWRKETMKARIKKFISTWKEELWMIPILILSWFASPTALRWIDPTAGVLDAGVLQLILYTLLAFMTFSCFTWIFIRLTFPEIWMYFQNNFYNDFKDLKEWVKLLISLSVYFGLLLLLAVLFKVL